MQVKCCILPHKYIVLIVTVGLLVMSGCAPSDPRLVKTADTPQIDSQTNLDNPASILCEELGFNIDIRRDSEGNQFRSCMFSEEEGCEEWAFYHDECSQENPNWFGATSIQLGENVSSQTIAKREGILVNPTDEPNLKLYSPQGELLGTWRTGPLIANMAHILGPIEGEFDHPSLIFLNLEENTQVLKLCAGQNSTLSNISQHAHITALIGVPGKPIIAYSTLKPSGQDIQLKSEIVIGKFNPTFRHDGKFQFMSSDSTYTTPVAIQVSQDVSQGIWITNRIWGIGGDLFTNPEFGLSFLDIGSGERTEFLSNQDRYLDLSNDQTWVASSTSGKDSLLQLIHLYRGVSTSFPRMKGHERGPSHVEISPRNLHIAWLEGKGIAWDGNLEGAIRIGNFSGDIIREISGSYFGQILGIEGTVIPVPVSWLNDETLLINLVVQGDRDPPMLISMNISSGEVIELVRGLFVEFGYTFPG